MPMNGIMLLLVSGKTFQCIFRHSVCRIADVTAVQEY